MAIKLQLPKLTDLSPRLTVIGIGGAGCNAINNMIAAGLNGVDFVVANTDAQSLAASSAEHRIQLGITLTEGLGAGARPEIGQKAAEEAIEEIRAQVSGSHMVFLAAGMGGGTGTGAISVIARAARDMGILTVAVVTKPFDFEGTRRMRVAEAGIGELRKHVDTLIVIPNQNLFRIANEKTSFAEAFVLADQVLYSGIACIVDLIIKEGLINLDFADVRAVLANMGSAMMGTGEAQGDRRATLAAEEAITNPLLENAHLSDAKGLLLSITGGPDLTLFEVDEAASRVRQEVSPEANIIVGATFDASLEDRLRVSIVASGMGQPHVDRAATAEPSGQALGWPENPPPVQTPHVETYSYTHGGPQPPPNLSPLMSGDGYAASFEPGETALSNNPQAGGLVEPGHVWQGPDDVLIEERRPASGMPDTATGAHADPDHGAISHQRDRVGDDAFSPAAPVEMPRGRRRMPEVEDFPVVGQKAYYARMGADPLAANRSPGSTGKGITGERKPGILARLGALTGMGGYDDRGPRRRERGERQPDRVMQDDSNHSAVEYQEQRNGSHGVSADEAPSPRKVDDSAA